MGRDQLRLDSRFADRGRAVRLRERRLHRGVALARRRVRARHGGTLFLDEVTEMPLRHADASCCACSRAGAFIASAAPQEIKTDIRVVAATNADHAKRGRERTAARGSLLSPRRVSRCTCRRCASAPATCRRSPSISSACSIARNGTRKRFSPAFAEALRSGIAGRATCAS